MPTGEFDLIRRHFTGADRGPGVLLGVGDDAALLQLEPGECLVTSVDTSLVGVHFPEGAEAADVAWRAVAVAASDLAAMGARPLAMTLAVTLPCAEESWLEAFARGLRAVSEYLSLPLVGGDTVRGSSLSLTVQVLGAALPGDALRRSGASAGDQLLVSGTLGNAAAGLALLTGALSADATQAERLLGSYLRPSPRLRLGEALRGIATAALDISDGLLADAAHIARASSVCLVIESGSIPLSPELRACAGSHALDYAVAGDDYELLFTLPPGLPPPPECTVIGSVVAGAGVEYDYRPRRGGYTHF